jgi:hypothetical protein
VDTFERVLHVTSAPAIPLPARTASFGPVQTEWVDVGNHECLIRCTGGTVADRVVAQYLLRMDLEANGYKLAQIDPTLDLREATVPTGFGHMYHVSPRKNRESILANGLTGFSRDQVGSPWGEGFYRKYNQPPGNYFFDNPEDAHEYVYSLGDRAHKDHGPGFPGDDPEAMWEERYEQEEPPEGFHEWPSDEQDAWYDNHDYQEREDDPQGYDIWKVQTAGHPMLPDPETRLVQKPTDLGNVHDKYQKHLDVLDHEDRPSLAELHREVGGYSGSEPNRYYSPVDVHPSRIQLHRHVPRWDMTTDTYHDLMDNSYERESPQLWKRLPLTEVPMPGHESSVRTSSWPVVHIARPVDDGYWGDESRVWDDSDVGKWAHLYHGTNEKRLPSIWEHGIVPWDEKQPEWGHGNTTYKEPHLVPRPGHTYFTRNPDYAWRIAPGAWDVGDMHEDSHDQGKVILHVDPAYMRAEHINPDEDTGEKWRDSFPMGRNDPRGEWAENEGYGDDPEETTHILEHPDTHTVAYRDRIPPEAIRGTMAYTGLTEHRAPDGTPGWMYTPNPGYQPFDETSHFSSLRTSSWQDIDFIMEPPT